MSSTALTNYTLSNSNAPFMMLPDHVDGFIDLKTLADIHRFLSQSASDEDLTLAAWVKEHYLYEPIAVDGREIRTTEGFSKLDRAYRRVRSLTNKAQDKWPFFDRTWKTMSTTTVRNNARGEAAPGISLPGMNNVARDLPMSNGQDAPVDSPVQSGPTLFRADEPTLHQKHPNSHAWSHPISNTPVSPLSTKQKQAGDPSASKKQLASQEQPKSATQLQPESISTEAPPKNGAQEFQSSANREPAQSDPAKDGEFGRLEAPSEESVERSVSAAAVLDAPQSSTSPLLATEDAAQDAGAGKIRGPNGRFMPKEQSRISTGDGRGKIARESRSFGEEIADRDEAEATSPAFIEHDDETLVDVTSTPAYADRSKPEGRDSFEDWDAPIAEETAPALTIENHMEQPTERPLSETASSHLYDDMTLHSATLAHTLAAEADPISSNLDRLPPSSLRQKKRKSEATNQEEPRRKRGRPRLSEQRRLEAEKEAEREATGEPLAATGTKETVEEESSKMITRRTARQSAVVKTDPVTPAKPVSTKPTPKKQQKQAEVQEDETVVGANDEVATSNRELLPHAPGLSNPSSATTTTRKQSATVTKAPSQVVSSTTKDTSDGTKDTDLLILDSGKTKSAPKRSKSKKSLTIKSNRNTGALTNGTSKAPAKQIVEPPPSALVEPTQASKSHVINGTTPNSSTNSAAAPHTSAKVEYFARVHTWIGVQEVPLARNKLTEDAEIIQKYAEWMEAEGVQIPYLSFKSIFGFAKKG